MKIEAVKWLMMASCAAIAVAAFTGLSLYSPLIMEGDPYGLLRYVLLRLTALSIAVPALIGLMLAVDFITPGDWMNAIGEDPKACSYLMAAVVLVSGAVICWT